jgi:hypothetical protein
MPVVPPGLMQRISTSLEWKAPHPLNYNLRISSPGIMGLSTGHSIGFNGTDCFQMHCSSVARGLFSTRAFNKTVTQLKKVLSLIKVHHHIQH